MNYEVWTPTETWIIGTLLLIVRYLVIAGLAYWLFYRVGKKQFIRWKIRRSFPRSREIGRAIAYSLFTFFIYGGSIWLYIYWKGEGITRNYDTIEEYGIPYFILSIVMMILMHDTYFYWSHRLIHHPRIYPYVHRVHHQFKNPTPWAAFAFHPLESILTMGIIPLILFLVPFHQAALVVFITIMVAYTTFLHLGFTLPALGMAVIRNDSRDHDYHHHKGHGNYGLYFNIWDKLMGTYCVGRKGKHRGRIPFIQDHPSSPGQNGRSGRV